MSKGPCAPLRLAGEVGCFEVDDSLAPRPSPPIHAKVSTTERSRRMAHLFPTAIGLIAEPDFGRARKLIPSLMEYCDYWDWREAREGLWLGLSISGRTIPIVCVSLPLLVAWREQTAKPLDEEALDALAAAVCAMRVL